MHVSRIVSAPMPQWDPTEFQQTINQFLARRGWSQPTLARVAGISQAVVNRWLAADRTMLVQPTDPTLRKLAPVVGISHGELMRMAGRIDAPAAHRTDKPTALVQFLADMEAGWLAADEQRRPIGEEVARAALPIPHERRPNRRNRGNNAGLGHSKMDYLKHK